MSTTQKTPLRVTIWSLSAAFISINSNSYSKKQIRTNFDLRNSSDLLFFVSRGRIRFASLSTEFCRAKLCELRLRRVRFSVGSPKKKHRYCNPWENTLRFAQHRVLQSKTLRTAPAARPISGRDTKKRSIAIAMLLFLVKRTIECPNYLPYIQFLRLWGCLSACHRR